MCEYIIRRCIIIIFFISAILFILSFFINDWQFTRYHDVKIISEQTVKKINTRCSNPSHSHYYVNKIIVNWQGIDSSGNIKSFETEFDDKDDSHEGISYQDLHQGIAKKVNSKGSFLTLIFFIATLILALIAYFNEDLDYSYSHYEKLEITKFRYYVFYNCMIFFGFDKKILDTICDDIECNNDKIPSYESLYYKYKKLVNEQEKRNSN